MTVVLKNLSEEQERLFELFRKEANVSDDQLEDLPSILPQEEEESDYVAPTKEEILDGIRQGLREIKLHQAGKLHLKTLKEVIDELQCSTVA